MPSSWELEVESWSIVANGFDRDESCSSSGAMVTIRGKQFGEGPFNNS